MGIQGKKKTITRFVKDTPHSISDTNDVIVTMVSPEGRCSLLLAWAMMMMMMMMMIITISDTDDVSVTRCCPLSGPAGLGYDDDDYDDDDDDDDLWLKRSWSFK